MTREEWIKEAMRLHDEAAALSNWADIYNDGCQQDGKSVEQQASEAEAEHKAARDALEAHLSSDWV